MNWKVVVTALVVFALCVGGFLFSTLDIEDCPDCGKHKLFGDYCSECGYNFKEWVCPKCGAETPDGSKYCQNCGGALNG